MRDKREDIQVLRAVAISVVLLFHFFPNYFPNGYVGVDIFFVISGYLMCLVLSKPPAVTLAVLKDFYMKRAKRILPLYYLLILLTLLLLICLLPELFSRTNEKATVKAVLLTTNFKTGDEDTYTQQMTGARNLFTHTWSLCVEMQFYLLVPFVMSIRKILGTNRRADTVFTLAIGISSLLLFVCVPTETAFNSVFTRMWQFMSGFIAFDFSRAEKSDSGSDFNEHLILKDVEEQSFAEKNKDKSRLWTATIYSMALLLLSGLYTTTLNPTFLRLLCTSATAILMQQGSLDRTARISNGTLYQLGEASYSIYLVHWPLNIIGRFYFSYRWYADFAFLLISLVVGFATHYLFEKRYLSWSTKTSFTVIGVLFVTCFLTSTNIVNIKKTFDSLFIDEHFEKAIKFNQENNVNTDSYPWQKPWSIQTKCNYSSHPVDNGNKRFATCPVKDGKLKFLLVGNSFASNQMPSVYKVFMKYASQFNVWSYPSCEALVEREKYAYCSKNHAYSYLNLTRTLKPDVLFILAKAFVIKKPIQGNLTTDVVFQDMWKMLQEYENIETVKRIYIFGAFPTPIQMCCTTAIDYLKKGVALRNAPPFMVEDQSPVLSRYDELQKKCKKCKVYDTRPSFVNRDISYNATFVPFDDQNRFFFEDGTHLNVRGLEQINSAYEELEKDFKKNVLKL